MGIEFDISKELGSISVTLAEVTAIRHIVNTEISGGEFHSLFNQVMMNITVGYSVVTDNLLPFCELESEETFISNFDQYHAAYAACYLNEISKPRNAGEQGYEEYLVLKTMKQFQTSYPLLKRTFARLDQYIGKWIDNDAWLAMCIDNLFKRLQALLNEIAALKAKDPADAFIIFNAAFTEFKPFLELIRQTHQEQKLAAA